MRRADRLFELIHLLRRARKAVTAVQLAEALEVAPRTCDLKRSTRDTLPMRQREPIVASRSS